MLPIRKTGPGRVSLTSYYGKVFVNRSKKVVDNYGVWLQNQLTVRALSSEEQVIQNVVMNNCFDSDLKSPRVYSALSEIFSSLDANGFHIDFDRKTVKSTYPKEILAKAEKNNQIVIGHNGTQYLVIDLFGKVKSFEDDQYNPIGSFESFLGLDQRNAPVDYATASVFGKDIPVGIILGIEMGFSNLLNVLKLDPKRIETGTRYQLAEDEYSIVFSDETLILSRNSRLATMILSGFNAYAKAIKQFSIHSFDQRGVYINLLEVNGLGTRYVREMDLQNTMFVDHITRDILIEMNEPITYQGLLFRASQMLLEDAHPHEMDPAYMRIKGYERLAGAVYTELIQSLRQHNGSLSKGNSTIQMNPYAIWRRVSEDPAKMQSSEINPIASLKEQEAVTYGGTGGRSGRSMTKQTRVYNRNDMGTISEATVDNADVGINVFTSANPLFTSLRGMSSRLDMKNIPASSLISTSALLAPCSDRDDARRTVFSSIQQQHAIPCDGYHQAIVRTGYETVIADRTTDLWAFIAKKPGKVRQINDVGVIIDYDDGDTHGYELGRRFGNAQGLTIPHHIKTPLKVGDKVEVGDAIVYNTGFFELDFFNPKKLVWKNSINVKTVVWESANTYQDSSGISTRVANLLKTKVTKEKYIIVNFDQTVHDLVKVGSEVNAYSTLCVIEDAFTANTNLFNQQSIETLKMLSNQAPRANVKGVVERIEIYYHGDKEDMSESLLALTEASDKELRRRANSMNKRYSPGKVDAGFRIDNNPLSLDTLAIKVYITTEMGTTVGD